MILLLLAAAAAQPQAETPRAFLERVYANYQKPGFNPLFHPDLYFAPPLVAAIAEDSRLFRDEVGYLDGDPICQCQDPTGLKASITGVTEEAADKAVVQVSIGLTGYEPRPAQFSLIRTSAGWRIADISTATEPSFLRGIEETNRRKRAGEERR